MGKSVVIFNAIVNTASRASGSWRSARTFEKQRVRNSRKWSARELRESSLWETEAGRTWMIVWCGTCLCSASNAVWELKPQRVFRLSSPGSACGLLASALRHVMHMLERS